MTNTTLAEFCIDLGSARDKNDLVAVINNRVKKLLDFSNCAVLADDPLTGILQKIVIPQRMSVRDCPINLARCTNGPAILTLTIVPLRSQDAKCIGYLVLFHKHSDPLAKAEVELLIAIAAVLSPVADNLFLREMLKRKEGERALLLSFCSHLATVNDLNGLRFVISQYLKRLLNSREYAITLKNPDNSYSYLLYDWVTDDHPVLFHLKDVLTTHKYSFSGATIRKAVGVDSILGIKLKVGEEETGVLWLHPGQTDDRLLTGVTAQLAVAIANAMAFREMVEQADELKSCKKRLEKEKSLPEKESGPAESRNELIGAGAVMQRLDLFLRQVAPTKSSVLILGETGTGKELIAHAIHAGSDRRDKPMIKVNCAALPANLIESELFGHERGSFTGAVDRKIGKFELAADSTLFLDEIGELPFNLQVKLLRAIQEKEIERVGGKKTIKVNVRIIAATNRDLQKEVDEGRFRCDLYYRLNVFPIFVPPLRNRLEDVPLLAAHFIQKLGKKTGSKVTSISRQALDGLMRYHWPGNIRELENWIERSLLITEGPVINLIDVPGSGDGSSGVTEQDALYKTLDENEREYIVEVLKKCNWRVGGSGGAADILDVNTSTLHSRMRKLGIKKVRSFRCTNHE